MESVVQKYVESVKSGECKRLGIPESFIDGIHYCRKEFIGGSCNPSLKNGNVVSVDIEIDENEGPLKAKRSFFHEIKHAQQYFKNDYREVHFINPIYYEIEAFMYEWKRFLEECISDAGKKLKKTMKYFS